MKLCVACHRQLSLATFNRKKAASDGLQNVCRDCNRERARRYYRENRERHLRVIAARTLAAKAAARALVGAHLSRHPCIDCGEDDIRVLDFDHLPDSGKTGDVMALVRNGYSASRIREEIAKCEVRCRNCHARITSERRGRDWRSDYQRREAPPRTSSEKRSDEE